MVPIRAPSDQPAQDQLAGPTRPTSGESHPRIDDIDRDWSPRYAGPICLTDADILAADLAEHRLAAVCGSRFGDVYTVGHGGLVLHKRE